MELITFSLTRPGEKAIHHCKKEKHITILSHLISDSKFFLFFRI